MGKIYNLDSVNEMAGGDQEFIKVIVQTFLEEIPPDVRAMSEAMENENPTLAYQYAHKMKPNLELFGLKLMDKILLIEAWAKGKESTEDAIIAGNKISERVSQAEQELKNDFQL